MERSSGSRSYILEDEMEELAPSTEPRHKETKARIRSSDQGPETVSNRVSGRRKMTKGDVVI